MKKFISMTLVVLMILSALPLSVFAASVNFDLTDSGCDFYNIIDKNDYNLAPGAVESEIIVNDDTGSNRNVLHVIEVDLSNPNISVMPTYMGLNENSDFEDSTQWGAQVLTEQAAHVENDLGLNVVGGMNTCLRYTSDHPYGVLVWNGKVYSDERNASGVSTAQTFLAVSEDGVASLHSASEAIPEGTYQAISANFGWIIKDGVSQYKDDHADSGRAPRSVLAIKETGELILLMNDGRQAPFSAGATYGELAEWLLAMGCVDAVNCDGGGSSTFISEREGTGELTMKSSPSDGGQRATLGGILVISKAVADGNFDHAVIEAESDSKYVTPGSVVNFSAIGADSAGGPADIPEDITWQLADPSMGTVEDGVFTSNGTVGTATVQMVYNGEVVGEDYIEVVIPEKIEFVQTNMTIPFGKTAILDIKATVNNGLNTVVVKEADFSFELSDSKLGTITGFEYTTCGEDAGISSGSVTATLVYDTTITAYANINLGKGSEIVWDFEDGNIESLSFATGYGSKHSAHKELGRFEFGSIEVVDSTTGQVKNGDKALAVVCDYSDFYAMGYNMLKLTGLNIDMTDAVGVGFWIYLTPEATGLELDFNNAIPFDHGTAGGDGYEEEGWYYVYAEKSSGVGEYFNNLYFYHTDGYDSATSNNIPNIKTKFTVYIDDITVDYSTVVEDRDAPTFTSVNILKDADTYEAINGQTITNNTVTIMAEAKENTNLNNYTGLDTSSVRVYVDGVQLMTGVSCASNGAISIDNLTLSDGIHTIRIEIADNAGNYRAVTRQLVIDATDNAPAVSFVPADENLDKLPIGSVYYMNLEVSDISKISELTTHINLDGSNVWQLDYVDVATGFDYSYTIDEKHNNAIITFTRNGEAVDNNETVLASIPIRTWEYTLHIDYPDCVSDGQGVCNFVSTPSQMWSGDGQFRIAICVSVLRGEVEFTDGTTDTFSSEEYVIDTEMDKHRNLVTQVEKNAKSSWHVHNPVSIDDKEATCTEAGYTGRTVCVGCSCGNTAENPCDSFDGCGSVVDWGTIIPATGHSFAVEGDYIGCENCDETVDSTGIVTVGDNMYYLIGGKLATGWQSVGSDWVYADPDTKCVATGTTKVDGITFQFDENGILTTGTWYTNSYGKRYYYGPSYYKRTWQVIDGDTYWFEADGYTVSGYFAIKENVVDDTIWYLFAEDGKLIERVTKTGFIDLEDGRHYVVNGVATHAGLVLIDGDYYYINSSCMAVVGEYTINEGWTNGHLPAGTYTFGEDGKMIIEVKDGFVTGADGNLYYYVNDELIKTGLTKIDGNYYYLSTTNGKVAVNVTRQVAYNCIDDSAKDRFTTTGTYTFGEDGKMVIEKRDGFVLEGDGNLYYYENDVLVKTGLTKIDGNYYYLSTTNGKVAVNVTRQVAYNCIDDSAKDRFTKTGIYTFGEDGKMLFGKNGFVTESDGNLYYYESDVVVKTGLTKIDGNYYYLSTTNGKVAVNVTRQVAYNCIDDSAKDRFTTTGIYTFGADGKMVIEKREGFVEENGNLYYYENDTLVKTGLTKIDGNYYYLSTTNGKVAVNVTRQVAYNCIDDSAKDRFTTTGIYTFGADGKMVIE